MLKRFFGLQTKTIGLAASLLAVSSILSALLGLIRDRLLAGRFGAGESLDIYFAAFRIPDLVYGILITGGITTVFLPVFSEFFKKNEKEAWDFVSNLLNCFFVFLVLLCGVLFVFAPLIINLIVPGFSAESKELAVSLTRIMFLSPILFGLSSIFSGILHYFNKFLVYSLAPILYNLGIIIGIVFLVPLFGIYGVAFGVILGALFYLLLQIPAAVKSGYKHSFSFNFKYSGLDKVFKLMVPRIVGTTAYHLNLIVITAIASTLTVGSIAIFNFSNNLQYFPIGFIGISFSLASFPFLSRNWAEGLKEKFLESFHSTFRQILFLVLPVSFLLFILRGQIVHLILRNGNFSLSDANLTAASLGIFCFSIFASAFIPFLSRVFYSFQNTKTPVLIALSSIALNICLSIFFVRFKGIGIIGLPLALSISYIVQFLMLLAFLKKEISEINLKGIFGYSLKILIASLFSALAAFFSLGLSGGILIQIILAGIFWATVYVFICYLLKIKELKTAWLSIINRFQE